MEKHVTVHVSYVVPAFNDEIELEASVTEANQRLTDLGYPYEIVIVNDASTDGTAGVADSLAKKLPDTVRVVHLSRNVGHTSAVAAGIAAAHGAVVAFARRS
jgi:glycosyltransferase involved in cell wall biosynthesis